MHGMPHLFLLGQGQPTGGSVSAKVARHWLLQFDGRFAHWTALVFYLFNQWQRHHACTKAAMRVKGGATGLGKFIEFVNDVSLRERLERAVLHPASHDARTIASVIMRCVTHLCVLMSTMYETCARSSQLHTHGRH